MSRSITDPLVQFAVDVIDKLGLVGVFLLMVGESACLPIPSEGTMLFAGFNVANGEYSLLGRDRRRRGRERRRLVDRLRGRLLRPRRPAREARPQGVHQAAPPGTADDWFERYGDATVFFSRMLPIVRTFISLPAGVAKMPFLRFTVFTTLGCIPWVFMIAFIGKQAGDNWEDWKEHLHYVDYAVVAAIVIGIVWLFVRTRRARRPRAHPAEAVRAA